MFAWLRQHYRQRRLKRLMDEYFKTGEFFGDLISCFMISVTAPGFRCLLEDLAKLERLYVDAGYRPISVEQWEEWGGSRNSKPILGVLREPCEVATYPVGEYLDHLVALNKSMMFESDN